jgi:hypothetical protein
MSTFAPFAIGAAALIAATVDLALGYRTLPARIPKFLDIDTLIMVPWSARPKLQAMVASHDAATTLPRWFLLYITALSWLLFLGFALGSASRDRLLLAFAVVGASLMASANVVNAVFIYFQIRAARPNAGNPPGRIVPAWFSQHSRTAGLLGFLVTVVYCVWACIKIRATL